MSKYQCYFLGTKPSCSDSKTNAMLLPPRARMVLYTLGTCMCGTEKTIRKSKGRDDRREEYKNGCLSSASRLMCTKGAVNALCGISGYEAFSSGQTSKAGATNITHLSIKTRVQAKSTHVHDVASYVVSHTWVLCSGSGRIKPVSSPLFN